MSLSGTYNLTISALGILVQGEAARTGTQGIDAIDDTLPVGHAGTLTTATIALVTGHGHTTGTFDVHGAGWCRYGCTVTIAGDTGTVAGGAGDALADGAVVMTPAIVKDATFDGDNVVLIGVGVSRQTSIRFMHDATVKAAILLVAGASWGWAEDLAVTNPIAGDHITSIEVSNGDATYTSALKMTGLQY